MIGTGFKKLAAFFGVLCFAALICAGIAFAQGDFKIRSSADKTRAVIGEVITLTVSISSNSGVSVEPTVPDLKDFDIRGTQTSSRISFVNGAQNMEINYIYALRPIRAGKLTIGEFTINYTGPDGKPAQAKTSPIAIESLPEEKKEPAPAMKEQPEAPSTRPASDEKERIISGYMMLTTAIIIFIFASIWAIVWYNARKEKITAKLHREEAGREGKLHIDNLERLQGKAEEKDEQPIIIASRDHAAASEKKDEFKGFIIVDAPELFEVERATEVMVEMYKQNKYKEICAEMARLLKGGMGACYRQNMLDMTTGEFLARLETLGLERKKIGEIGEILEFCDMVNYAKYSPQQKEIDEKLQSIKNIRHIFERGAR